MGVVFIILLLISFFALPVFGQEGFETDVFKTSAGDLEITFLGHGTLMLRFDGKVIHIDPIGRVADYDKLPRGDIVFITHHHGDHLDLEALKKIRQKNTVVILSQKCADKVKDEIIMKNGDVRTVAGIKVEAVPAYNLVHKRDNGQFFHPKGEGNGYVLTLGDKRIYFAGDTENTPVMKELKNIDVAFLPMNLPYTMTPEMVADAAAAFKPKVLYPYHYGETDPTRIVDLLKDNKDIEVRVRKMK